jgi:hypothetical protein
MPARYFRIWIELDEYDPDTDEWMDVVANFGPSATFASDASEGGRARAQAAAIAFAEHLHAAAALVLAEAGADDIAS